MTFRKSLLVAAVVLLSVPVVPALAHDDEDYGYNSHDRFHDQLSDAHERAHEYGFYSRGEHRAYHRAELSPKFGDGGNREGGISWGCLTPPLLHRRSDMPCSMITSSS